jgi:hypothetical protein
MGSIDLIHHPDRHRPVGRFEDADRPGEPAVESRWPGQRAAQRTVPRSDGHRLRGTRPPAPATRTRTGHAPVIGPNDTLGGRSIGTCIAGDTIL